MQIRPSTVADLSGHRLMWSYLLLVNFLTPIENFQDRQQLPRVNRRLKRFLQNQHLGNLTHEGQIP